MPKGKRKGKEKVPSNLTTADADSLNAVAASAIVTEAAANSELLAQMKVLKTDYDELEQELLLEQQTAAANKLILQQTRNELQKSNQEVNKYETELQESQELNAVLTSEVAEAEKKIASVSGNLTGANAANTPSLAIAGSSTSSTGIAALAPSAPATVSQADYDALEKLYNEAELTNTLYKAEYETSKQEKTECFAKNAEFEIEVQTCASNLQLSKATNALLDKRLESTVDARDRLQREYNLQTRKVQTLSNELSTLTHSHHPALYRKMHLGALAAPASVHLCFAPRIAAVDEGGKGVATYVDCSDARSGREFVCDTQSDLRECVQAYAAQIYKQDSANRPTIDRLADSRHVVLVARAPRYAVLLAPSCTAKQTDVLERLAPEDRNINDAADDGRYAPWSRACSEMWTKRYQVFERKHLPSDLRTALAVLFS
ncbi:hypothetical protein CYMTET_14656 [Cymbomonas tetramitiformis]|uniref:Uncharacterized protein n=1 Tax=Cymbomonas tetramitiformis TaxID=36881 RepID=A0AAE0GFY6_9CHLO|nr:hypothetical protein CYMTET_14656 [Cymbomonas tetramitiformis]